MHHWSKYPAPACQLLSVRGRRDSSGGGIRSPSPVVSIFFFLFGRIYSSARPRVNLKQISSESTGFIGEHRGTQHKQNSRQWFLLTNLNPFLTREPRSKGFEGITTEICLIQHVQTKQTDRQHACRQSTWSWLMDERKAAKKHECRS